jgi:hypothetical protein
MTSISNTNNMYFQDEYAIKILTSLKTAKNDTEESIDVESPYIESDDEVIDVEAPYTESDDEFINVES